MRLVRREKETSSVHRLQGHKWPGVNDRARRTPKEQYCKAAYAKVYETTMAVCNEGPKISPNNALPPQPICSIKFLFDESGNLGRLCDVEEVEGLSR